MIDLKNEQFSAGELARAIGVSDANFQNWVRRATYLDLPGKVGGRRLFSAEFAIRVGWMKGLLMCGTGIGPEAASFLVTSIGKPAGWQDTTIHGVGPEPLMGGFGYELDGWMKDPAGCEMLVAPFDFEGKGARRTIFADGLVAEITERQARGEQLSPVWPLASGDGAVILAVGAIAKGVLANLEQVIRSRGRARARAAEA